MNFTSDNSYGAAPRILDAVVAANTGAAASYGNDPLTEQLQEMVKRVFEHDTAVFPVVTGTAANALVMATLCPPHGAILCHERAHIAGNECGASEFFTHGAKLVPIEGMAGKLTPEAIEHTLAGFRIGFVHQPQPAVISLTQASEFGTVYTPAEIAAISAVARKHNLKLHVDGARFANAVAYLGCTPAEATWKAGIDALSFGATKNGALGAEAVIFFDAKDGRDFEYRRKKSGHLLSKMRFVSAQLVSYLEDRHWLDLASRANALAQRMAQGLAAVPGAEVTHPVEANAIFVRFPNETIARLRKAGALFYDWAPPENGRTLVRLVLSFATPEADVERFLDIAQGRKPIRPGDTENTE
ncbi:MAG: low specificity L-threonine aldolase [Rhizomicrobium sp.]